MRRAESPNFVEELAARSLSLSRRDDVRQGGEPEAEKVIDTYGLIFNMQG